MIYDIYTLTLTERSVKNIKMSPRSKKQIEELKEVKRKLIMNSALELFADYGYHGTSINMIAKKAGIAKGLIYTYFENKESLIKELVLGGIEEFSDIFDPNNDGVLTEEEFEFFVNESFKLLESNMKFWRLYFVLVMKKEIIEMFGDKFKEFTLPFINVLTDYYKRKNHANAEAEALLLGSVMDGVSLNFLMDPKIFPLHKVKELIINKFK